MFAKVNLAPTALATFMLVSCSPALSPSTPAELGAPSPLSSDAISLVLEEVSCRGSRTVVRLLAEADRSYWGDIDATPPPHASLRDSQLIDERGHAYPIDYEWGDPAYLDPSKDALGFRLSAAFQGLACDSDKLVFTSGVAFGGIPSDATLAINIGHRTLGDSWQSADVVSLAGMAIPVDDLRITLISSLEDDTPLQQPALEFHAKPIQERGIRLECLDFLWIGPQTGTTGMSWSCESSSSSIVSSIIGGPLAPLLTDRALPWDMIEVRPFGTVVLVEPRVLTWPAK